MHTTTAANVRPGDWIRPDGSEWPREVARVTACTPLDLYGTGTREMVRRRFYFDHTPDSPVVEYHVDALVVTY